MIASARTAGARNAGAFLHELLLGPYRHRWQQHSERGRTLKVNSLAVAKVVADYVGFHPTASRGWETDASRIKDIIWRALTGRAMSRETLELLIAAFAIAPSDADILWGQWNGTEPARVVIGSMAPRNGVTVPVPRFQTVQRQEFHYLGPDGQPTRHRTVQAIRALVDDYSSHPLVLDTSEVTVSRIHGGVPGPLRHLGGSLWALDIALPHALSAGEVTSMEFVTEFHHTTPLEHAFRYAAHQRVQDLVIRIEFDKSRLPSSVVWCEWEDYRDPSRLRSTRDMSLDSENAVGAGVDVLQRAAIGFVWDFRGDVD